jgi:hypothetical protein
LRSFLHLSFPLSSFYLLFLTAVFFMLMLLTPLTPPPFCIFPSFEPPPSSPPS